MAGSPVTRRDVVCDLGAGLGALTRPLAGTGARVIAVELHPARAEALRREHADSRVAVVERDLRDFRFPGRPFRVVANPPYAGINARYVGCSPTHTCSRRTWSWPRVRLAGCCGSPRPYGWATGCPGTPS